MTAAPVLQPSGDEVLVASRLFGPLAVRRDAVLTFRGGLPGFAGERRFVLLPAASEGVFWLQSADEGALAFLLVDPFTTFPGYEVDVPEAELAGSAPLVLAMVTLPREEGDPCTANLQAPLLIDLGRREGRQLILEGAAYGPRHEFDLRSRLSA
jgi:flagellar assembly factor FliW